MPAQGPFLIAPGRKETMRKTVALTICLTVLLGACGSGPPGTLKLISHDSFASAVDDNTFASFTADTGIEVEVIPAQDAGALVNQAVLTKDNPLADVLFGVDDTFLSRALDEGIFVPHESVHIDKVDPALTDPDHRVTPIDFGDVCINYDKKAIVEAALPKTLDDLREPEVAAQLTVEHPATSSPGLAFMLATIDFYGEDDWLEFWEELREGGVNVANDWDTAYYADFTRYGGTTPLVVSYASSPPAEVIFATEPTNTAPTGVVEAGCYRQVEYAGILSGTDVPDEAGQLIDFMLSIEFQETIPSNWFVFPANQGAALPIEFVEHTVIPSNPTRMDAARIAQNRDRWIDEWISVMEG